MKSNFYTLATASRAISAKQKACMAGATVMLALMGCSSSPHGEHWTLFNNAPTAAAVGQNAKIVVYRKAIENDPSTLDRSPANIYVDGNYIASLLPMASTEVLLCPGQHRVSARTNLPTSALGDKTANSTEESLLAGSVKYFMVQYAADATPKLFQVMAEQATKDMAGMRQQIHTLSRASAPKCV